ncbi:hypothetical protein NDU88_002901 [Pleurodeles waltl]|uniref:Secreted protein n=1 Tax=Pleurodeles waltl TaxID=8319 RepID=A0AAV7M3T6_PLEWA|nr:hypothetical protein NDU88_002901 [Pleurodeles waltl]
MRLTAPFQSYFSLLRYQRYCTVVLQTAGQLLSRLTAPFWSCFSLLWYMHYRTAALQTAGQLFSRLTSATHGSCVALHFRCFRFRSLRQMLLPPSDT